MNSPATAHHNHSTQHHFHPYHRSPSIPPLRYVPPSSYPATTTTTTTTTITTSAGAAAAANTPAQNIPPMIPSPKEQPHRGFSGDERDYRPTTLPAPQGPQRQSLPSIHEALGQTQPIPYAPPPRQQSNEFTPNHSSSQPLLAASHSPDPSRSQRHYGSQSSEGSAHHAPPHNRSHSPSFSPAINGSSYNHSPSSATPPTTTAPTSTTSSNPRLSSCTPALQPIVHASGPGPAPPSSHQSPPPPSSHPHLPSERANGYSPPWTKSHPPVNGYDDRANNGQPNGVVSQYGPTQPPSSYASSTAPPSHHPSLAEAPHPPPPPNHHQPYHDSRGWRSEEAEKYTPDAYVGGYGESIKRHLEVFDLDSALNEIVESSRQLLSFSSHYCQKAHNTHRSGPLPGSTPHLAEIDSMMKQSTRVQDSLNRMRSVVLTQQAALAERSKEQCQKTAHTASGGIEQQQHQNGYAEDHKIGGFAGADPKKRRGRAAPPGRCHSCNRAETPEWRRGPDGARTLCNACGLHYAKLTRKMGGNKAAAAASGNSSNLRPKMESDGPTPPTTTATNGA